MDLAALFPVFLPVLGGKEEIHKFQKFGRSQTPLESRFRWIRRSRAGKFPIQALPGLNPNPWITENLEFFHFQPLPLIPHPSSRDWGGKKPQIQLGFTLPGPGNWGFPWWDRIPSLFSVLLGASRKVGNSFPTHFSRWRSRRNSSG